MERMREEGVCWGGYERIGGGGGCLRGMGLVRGNREE